MCCYIYVCLPYLFLILKASFSYIFIIWQRIFICYIWKWRWFISTKWICIFVKCYMFVVVNFDALAQTSDIRIERRQVVFLCWMQDSNPGSQTLNRQQAECTLTNRLSYRGSSKKLELDSLSIWSASIQPTRLHYQLAFAPGSGDINVCYIHVKHSCKMLMYICMYVLFLILWSTNTQNAPNVFLVAQKVLQNKQLFPTCKPLLPLCIIDILFNTKPPKTQPVKHNGSQ